MESPVICVNFQRRSATLISSYSLMECCVLRIDVCWRWEGMRRLFYWLSLAIRTILHPELTNFGSDNEYLSLTSSHNLKQCWFMFNVFFLCWGWFYWHLWDISLLKCVWKLQIWNYSNTFTESTFKWLVICPFNKKIDPKCIHISVSPFLWNMWKINIESVLFLLMPWC